MIEVDEDDDDDTFGVRAVGALLMGMRDGLGFNCWFRIRAVYGQLRIKVGTPDGRRVYAAFRWGTPVNAIADELAGIMRALA